MWNLDICSGALVFQLFYYYPFSPLICFNWDHVTNLPHCCQVFNLLFIHQSVSVTRSSITTSLLTYKVTQVLYSTQIDLGKTTSPQMYYLDFTNPGTLEYFFTYHKNLGVKISTYTEGQGGKKHKLQLLKSVADSNSTVWLLIHKTSYIAPLNTFPHL